MSDIKYGKLPDDYWDATNKNKVTDIIEKPHPLCDEACMFICKGEAKHEIESLRQRVKELENENLGHFQANKNMLETMSQQRKELAALKQSQGEPVLWMQSDHLSKLVHKSCGSQSMLARCSDHKLQSDFKPLYTSAPTIPEGWQIVPIEPTDGMIVAAWNEDQYKDQDAEWADIYRAMLAASPAGPRPADYKPEDVK